MRKDVSIRLQNGDTHHLFGFSKFSIDNNNTIIEVDGTTQTFPSTSIDQIFIVVREKVMSVKFDVTYGVVTITYPNKMIVTVRECAVTNYVGVDVYFEGKNINREVYKRMYGYQAELPFGFANVDAEKLTGILNFVSNQTTGKEK